MRLDLLRRGPFPPYEDHNEPEFSRRAVLGTAVCVTTLAAATFGLRQDIGDTTKMANAKLLDIYVRTAVQVNHKITATLDAVNLDNDWTEGAVLHQILHQDGTVVGRTSKTLQLGPYERQSFRFDHFMAEKPGTYRYEISSRANTVRADFRIE
ncbi:MAG: hypothetical protein AAF732_04930 [Pseudomonadota bacterium]